jgi:hypothetical protein
MKNMAMMNIYHFSQKKAPNNKMQLTTGILPVYLNLRHPEVGSGLEVGSRPARRS